MVLTYDLGGGPKFSQTSTDAKFFVGRVTTRILLVCTAPMIAFLETLNVKPIPRVVIGVVIAVILVFSVSIVVVLNLVLHFINRFK